MHVACDPIGPREFHHCERLIPDVSEHSTLYLPPPRAFVSARDNPRAFPVCFFFPNHLSFFTLIFAQAYSSSNMMDPAQLDRCNIKWNDSRFVIIFLFSGSSITVFLRILTTLSFPKPTNIGDRRFTLADWTMIAAYVRALRSEGSYHYLMK